MSTITKERVAEIIHAAGLESCDYEAVFDSIKTGEIVAMARIALASLEAEPVAQVLSSRAGNDTSTIDKALPEGTTLFTAQPAPVVPDEREAFNAWNNDTDCPLAGRDAKTAAWLAWCRRAAMLQGAENSESRCSNSPVIPDGWVACSERMPEEGGRYWCYVEEQNDLGKSHYQWNCAWNGNRWWVEHDDGGRVTHWMPLPAAPQQEVKP